MNNGLYFHILRAHPPTQSGQHFSLLLASDTAVSTARSPPPPSLPRARPVHTTGIRSERCVSRQRTTHRKQEMRSKGTDRCGGEAVPTDTTMGHMGINPAGAGRQPSQTPLTAAWPHTCAACRTQRQNRRCKSARVSPKAAKVAAPGPQMSAISGIGALAVRNAVVPAQTAAKGAVPENLSSWTSLSWA
jgi:hypothetical protein